MKYLGEVAVVLFCVLGFASGGTLHNVTNVTGNVTNVTEMGPAIEPSCADCRLVAAAMRNRIQTLSSGEVFGNLFKMCSKDDSIYADCMQAVIPKARTIFLRLKDYLHTDQVCRLADTCGDIDLEVPLSEKNHESKSEADDLAMCNKCQQLLKRVQDKFVANKTESEFKEALESLCKQSGKFEEKCLGLVNRNYRFFYVYFAKEQIPKEFCEFASICPPPIKKVFLGTLGNKNEIYNFL